jgi:hypothetical protein
MANASSLNTLYSLINGPNADRIGGFIYNAQVDDAARQREATRQADASIALGNKQAEYSLASALSRSPETAAMFQPGREVLAPDMQDMAYSLAQNVPGMQTAELAGKKADTTYKLAAAGNMQRLASGGGGGTAAPKVVADATDKDQARIVAQYSTAMNSLTTRQADLEKFAAKQLTEIDAQLATSPSAKAAAKATVQRNLSQQIAGLNEERNRTTQLFTPLIKKGVPSPAGSAPTGEGLVPPTAAPQASTTAAPQPSAERDLRLSQLKAALPKATPEQRTKMLGMAAQYGITPEDLAK